MVFKEVKNKLPGYLLRAFCGLNDGLYWGVSVLTLFFGIYFAWLSAWLSGGLVIGITIGVAVIAAICMVVQYTREEKREEEALQVARKKFEEECETIKKAGGNVEELLKKISARPARPSLLSLFWLYFKRTLTRGREFLNSGKNGARVVIVAALLWLGFDFLLAGGMTTTLIAVIGLTGFAIAGLAGLIDYHRRRTRARKTEELKKKRRKLAQTDFNLKYSINREIETKYQPYTYSSKEIWMNRCKLGLRLFTGFIHGGYFGFSITGMILTLVLVPLFSLNPASLILLPILMASVFAVLQIGRNRNEETTEQSNEKKALELRAINQQKLTKLILEAKKLGIDYFQFKNSFDLKNIKPVEKRADGFWNKLWQGVLEVSVYIREGGRGIKNSTKIVQGIVITILTLTTLPLIGAGWPVLAGFAAFMLFFGVITCVEIYMRNQREKNVKAILKEAHRTEKEIKALQIEIKSKQQELSTAHNKLPESEPKKLSLAPSIKSPRHPALQNSKKIKNEGYDANNRYNKFSPSQVASDQSQEKVLQFPHSDTDSDNTSDSESDKDNYTDSLLEHNNGDTSPNMLRFLNSNIK